jgi:hypothetical protein
MRVVIFLALILSSCSRQQEEKSSGYIIVADKYAENTTTKDLLFGTGNWHTVDRYIIDSSGKIWDRFTKEDFIRVKIGDTMWIEHKYNLTMRK